MKGTMKERAKRQSKLLLAIRLEVEVDTKKALVGVENVNSNCYCSDHHDTT